MPLAFRISSISTYRACGDEDPTNNYAYITSLSPSNQINKIDITTGVSTSPVAAIAAYHCAAGPSVNYLVMTYFSVIHIYLKTDMSTVAVNVPRSGGPAGYTSLLTIDNLNAGMLYYFTYGVNALVKADLNTAIASTVLETMV